MLEEIRGEIDNITGSDAKEKEQVRVAAMESLGELQGQTPNTVALKNRLLELERLVNGIDRAAQGAGKAISWGTGLASAISKLGTWFS